MEAFFLDELLELLGVHYQVVNLGVLVLFLESEVGEMFKVVREISQFKSRPTEFKISP